jgi:hypothetical protein
MSNLLDLKEKDGRKNSQNIRKIDRPIYPNQRNQEGSIEEITEEENIYKNNYTKKEVGGLNRAPENNDIPITTLGLMLGTAIFFDLTQIIFAFAFMDWLVSFFAFLTFWLWFKFNKRSFVHPKRAVAIGSGVIIEMIPFLAILPGWTIMIILLIAIEKAEKSARKILGEGALGNKAISKISRFGSK